MREKESGRDAGRDAPSRTGAPAAREGTGRTAAGRWAQAAAGMVVESIREYRSGGAPHTVITGPARHDCANLVELQVANDTELQERWRIVRFHNNGIESADDLWRRAARCAGADNERTTPGLVLLERQIQGDGRRLLVIVDEFGELLQGLADRDQDWALRKTLQTEPRILVIGLARVMPADATGYEKAFYGFFTTRSTTGTA